MRKLLSRTLATCAVLLAMLGVYAAVTEGDYQVVGTVVDKAQLNKDYSETNKWYGFQWYTADLNISLNAYTAETALENLALEFDFYVEDFDDETEGVPEFITNNGADGKAKFNTFVELGYGRNQSEIQLGSLFPYDQIKKGWNHLTFKLSDLDAARQNNIKKAFDSSKPIKWFRLCFAHVYTTHAYSMRIKDVRIVDLNNSTAEVTEKTIALPNPDGTDWVVNGRITVKTAGAGGIWNGNNYLLNGFPGTLKEDIDLSAEEDENLWFEFDLELSEINEGAFNAFMNTNPSLQIQVASDRGKDIKHIYYANKDKQPVELGKHTYSFSLQGLSAAQKKCLSWFGIQFHPGSDNIPAEGDEDYGKQLGFKLSNFRISVREPEKEYSDVYQLSNTLPVRIHKNVVTGKENINLWSAIMDKGCLIDASNFNLDNSYYEFDVVIDKETVEGSHIYFTDKENKYSKGAQIVLGSNYWETYNDDGSRKDRGAEQSYTWNLPNLFEEADLKDGVAHVKLSMAGAKALDMSMLNYFTFNVWAADELKNTTETQLDMNLTIKNLKVVDYSSEMAKLTKLPSFISDNMILQQKKDAKIWGFSEAGAKRSITVTLTNDKDASKKYTATATADENGDWCVTLPTKDVAGGYDTYTMTVSDGENADLTVKNIVFGEVWIAAGQSNMAFTVNGLRSEFKNDILNNLADDADKIRFMVEPSASTTYSPQTPEKDIAGAAWYTGNDKSTVINCSAVAYYMAKGIQQKLNVPVGIINTAVGGSIIEAWLPTYVTEESEFAATKDGLRREGVWVDQDFWINGSTTPTGFFNMRVAPLANFNIAGTIWYQGESNSGRPQYYTEELKALKRGWSKTFGYENNEMPFVFNHVGPWITDTRISPLAEAMNGAWKDYQNNNMAQITIYDTDFNWQGNGTIHPTNKKPVGEKYATAVYNLVYGKSGEYTSPVITNVKFDGDKIILTYDHVGDGLTTKYGTEDIIGFTVAGEDGVHVNANAKITGKNTVEVTSPVAEPKSVDYAWQNRNMNANLCNSIGFMAVPFRSVKDATQQHMENMDWLEMDKAQLWGYEYLEAKNAYEGGYNASWTADNATLTFDNTNKVYGIAAMKVEATSTAKVSANVDSYTQRNTNAAGTAKAGNASLVANFKGVKGMTVYVKNPDAKAKSITLNITAADGTEYSAPATVEANSDYTPVVFDFAKFGNVDLGVIRALSFSVPEGTLYMDHAVLYTTAKDEVYTLVANEGTTDYYTTYSNLNTDTELSAVEGTEVKVYDVVVENSKMTLTERSDNKVAKGEGVLVKSNGSTVKATATTGVTASTATNLVATPATAQTVTAAEGHTLYRLTYNNTAKKEGLGFYLATAGDVKDGSKLNTVPMKAYLDVKTAAATNVQGLAKGFVIGEDTPTGISTVTVNNDVKGSDTDATYDLGGRSVKNPSKGVFIKNNKKVVIK